MLLLFTIVLCPLDLAFTLIYSAGFWFPSRTLAQFCTLTFPTVNHYWEHRPLISCQPNNQPENPLPQGEQKSLRFPAWNGQTHFILSGGCDNIFCREAGSYCSCCFDFGLFPQLLKWYTISPHSISVNFFSVIQSLLTVKYISEPSAATIHSPFMSRSAKCISVDISWMMMDSEVTLMEMLKI